MDVLYTFKIKIESQNWSLEDIDVLCTLKLIWMATILIIGVYKNSDHIWIKIKISNCSQEPPVSSKVPNEDLKDMDVLYTFKIKIESQNWILEDIDVLCTLKSIWMATILIIGV